MTWMCPRSDWLYTKYFIAKIQHNLFTPIIAHCGYRNIVETTHEYFVKYLLFASVKYPYVLYIHASKLKYVFSFQNQISNCKSVNRKYAVSFHLKPAL